MEPSVSKRHKALINLLVGQCVGRVGTSSLFHRSATSARLGLRRGIGPDDKQHVSEAVECLSAASKNAFWLGCQRSS